METALNRPTPATFVLFGITGDLSMRKILPALLSLHSKGLLPERIKILGFSRRAFTKREFDLLVRKEIILPEGAFTDAELSSFLGVVEYVQGAFDDPEAYRNLALKLQETDDAWGTCSSKLFHLSVSPEFYETILDNLSKAGLNLACADRTGWTRLIVEKPLGRDLKSFERIDALLSGFFEDSQIYRIDHYLGKPSVRKLMLFRKAYPEFEQVWNKTNIKDIRVSLREKLDVTGRGSFYDKAGALRDVGQNHVLELLAVLLMDMPEKLTTATITAARAMALKGLVPAGTSSLSSAVRGQYEGYLLEEGVAKGSQTETYFRLTLKHDSIRYADIPITIEAGKALDQSLVEVVVTFKDPKGCDCAGSPHDTHESTLAFTIQPGENISLEGYAPSILQGVKLPSTFKLPPETGAAMLPEAYEQLIHDAFRGDKTLFPTSEEISHSWKFVDSVVAAWDSIPLVTYAKGSKPSEIR